MKRSSNPATRHLVLVPAGCWLFVGSGFRPDLSAGRFDKAGAANSSSSRIMSTLYAKLDFCPNPAKSITSNFLIDNFGALIVRRPPQQLLYPDAGRAAKADCTPTFEPPVSRNSNRHIPGLESALSYRKQRTAPLSNRHKFAFCNSASASPTSSLKPPASRNLIANDVHSRKESTQYKQSTYKILIANVMLFL